MAPSWCSLDVFVLENAMLYEDTGIEGFTVSQLHQKFSGSWKRPEEATSPKESDSLFVRGSLTCHWKQTVRLWGPQRLERKKPVLLNWEHVNIFCLLGEQGWSPFHRGNCVYIMTLVCEENAMVCFDSSLAYVLSVNVPASLPHVPNTVLTECVVFK